MATARDMGRYIVPKWHSEIPVTLNINGRQVPPIETTGQILHFTFTSLKIRCDEKIPIPAKGTARFMFADMKEEMEMVVEFVQRFEKELGFWGWKTKKVYEMEVSLSGNSKEKQENYQHLLHRILFGSPKAENVLPETAVFSHQV